MSDSLPVRTMRYGHDADLPARRELRAGPVTAVLEGADLRYVRFGDTQIVLRLYMAVRNRNWDTIDARFTRFDVQDEGDHFRVDLAAEHVSGDVDFAWTGTIEGSPDGTIRYSMDGAPRKPFLKNRIGFCILHPMDLAGLPATVVTPEGTSEGVFPDKISPHQPFIDMISISHAAGPNGSAMIAFEGDLFETEDQRNWTDASYKTYSTPLRLPYPVSVTPDDQIRQSVTISVSGTPQVASGGGGPAIEVDFATSRPLPPIGFGAGRKPLADGDDLKRLRALKPAHLWADLDLGADTWRDRLHRATTNAVLIGAPLDLSVIGAAGDGGWEDLAAAVNESGAKLGNVYAFPPVTEPIVFPRFDLATHPNTIAAAKSAFSAAGIRARVGGGARAYFTELNRATDFLPVADLDVVTYTINAQVHAFDNLSVIETLAAQAATVESAHAIAGDRPLAIGPITLRPPYNPNATAAPPPAGPDRLPDPVDARQLSLFAAGWTVGSVHRLAAAGADALTYFELAGWRGLIEKRDGLTRRALFPSRPGQLFPLYHVFAAIAEFAGGEVCAVALQDELATEALALRHGDRVRLLITSFSEAQRQITVSAPGLQHANVRYLDETTYLAAADEPALLTRGGEPLSVEQARFDLSLRPFAIACVDGTLANR